MNKKNVKKEFTDEEKKMLEAIELKGGEEVIKTITPVDYAMEEPKYLVEGFNKTISCGIILTNKRFISLEIKGLYFPFPLFLTWIELLRSNINNFTRKFRKYAPMDTLFIKNIRKVEGKRHGLMKNILVVNDCEFFMHFDIVEEFEKSIKDLIQKQKDEK